MPTEILSKNQYQLSIMQTVAIEGTLRSEFGKKTAKAVRANEQVPCVIYGGEKVVNFVTHKNSFASLVYTPDFKIAEISLDGVTYRGIVKAIQFHPVSEAILHVDFVELVSGQKVRANVPLRVIGQAAGSKKGGTLSQKVRRVEIMTTPESLVDAMEVDVTNLDLAMSARIRDIKEVAGVTVLNAPAIPVVTIDVPRALRSAETKAATPGKK